MARQDVAVLITTPYGDLFLQKDTQGKSEPLRALSFKAVGEIRQAVALALSEMFQIKVGNKRIELVGPDGGLRTSKSKRSRKVRLVSVQLTGREWGKIMSGPQQTGFVEVDRFAAERRISNDLATFALVQWQLAQN